MDDLTYTPKQRAALLMVVVVAAAIASIALRPGSAQQAAADPSGVLRVSQLGFAPGAPKRALLMTSRPAPGVRFSVIDSHGRTVLSGRGPRTGRSWSRRWRHVYTLDLGRLSGPGTYRLRAGRARPVAFRIDSERRLYAERAQDAVRFFEVQRDGPDAIRRYLRRRPSHLNDRRAAVYQTPRYRGVRLGGPLRRTGRRIDVSGGWFDAGDYLKFTYTASSADVLMLLALRDYSAGLPEVDALSREARFGTDWLLKMWDQRRGVLYQQVGLGDGNGRSVLGDHDIWRRPQRDDGLSSKSLRFEAHRPVFAANAPGRPISPNLAGRTAAAFGLCAQVFLRSDPHYAHRCLLAGQALYERAAKRWRGRLLTSVPSSYYAQTEWRGDMELAAIELYLGTLRIRTSDLPHREPYDYVEPAATFADAYMSARGAGRDSLNLADLGALGQYDLYRVMVATGNKTNLQTNAASVLADLHDQLALGRRIASRDPFGLANIAGHVDTVPHALGYAIVARLYDGLTKRRAFESFAAEELGWLFGGNAWGASFVVGAGREYPRCLAHQVANLDGSLTGRGALVRGAVVDGPTDAGDLHDLGAPSGFRPCTRRASYRAFDTATFRYVDSVLSPSTSEPADDYGALALLAFAQSAAPPAHPPPLSIPR